ncbi:hypothetical protein FSC37_15360 [Piscinibacter aquaticus]|uniref:Uncharacterized protein n=1 Tax=Piscinibacter aquaticus TaxID=392597 RepID=A0A5C6U3U5_9BURK|nr:hypothetical protein FSC37_15360 [Piscinibacter aquaticus]
MHADQHQRQRAGRTVVREALGHAAQLLGGLRGGLRGAVRRPERDRHRGLPLAASTSAMKRWPVQAPSAASGCTISTMARAPGGRTSGAGRRLRGVGITSMRAGRR